MKNLAARHQPARSELSMASPAFQDKEKEIEFFDQHAAGDDYNVFTPASKARLIASFRRLTGVAKGAHVADLGCGSGTFTDLLRTAGYQVVGLDISPKLIALGRSKYPGLELIEGDIEHLPFANGSLDGVFLGGVVHHFPDPWNCVAEVRRILRQHGKFLAFDPNRCNPFMWAYRDRSSPLYSATGVTENERPVLAGAVRAVFSQGDLRCGPIICPGCPIGMSRRPSRGDFYRFTISSTPISSSRICCVD